jgi:hypothetical protein
MRISTETPVPVGTVDPESVTRPDTGDAPDARGEQVIPPPPRPSRRWWTTRALPLASFLLIGGIIAAVHVLAGLRPSAAMATLGETRLAVATVVVRGAELVVDPLPVGDRFAAIQLAMVQPLLPLAGIPIVDVTRWACLLLGAVSALLVWPVLRRLGASLPGTAIGVGLLGASLPAVALHSGISAGAPAVTWLMIAAMFAVRLWGKAAIGAALIAAATAPLVGAALLALAAHLVLGRSVQIPDRLRIPFGALLGIGAIAVAYLSVGSGPLAGVAGPMPPTSLAVAAVLAGLVVVGLAWRAVDWLRPVFSAATLLLIVGLVPGPSRITAALTVAPVLAMTTALLADRLGERNLARVPAVLGAAALLLLTVVPAPVVLANRPPPAGGTDGLITWLTTEPVAGTDIQADDLDRAELLAAGVPAARLRSADEPVEPGSLRLVSQRPTAAAPASGPVGCGGRTAVAAIERGTGGAPGAVCRTDGGAEAVTSESASRTRLGAALAENPALRLTPAAAGALRAGDVDPRLMLVLAAMTTAHQISIDDFPAAALDTPDLPRRRALLSVVDGVAPASSELLRTWLGAQQPPFKPSLIQPAGSALLVGYPAPPPSGLLPN